MTTKMHGQCLCAAVQFTIKSPTQGSAHCHCGFCRKAHGAPLVTWLVVPSAQFKLDTGKEELCWYQSSNESKRGFCSICGSTMFFEVHVTRANISGDVDRPPTYHCFVDEKVDWLCINDELTTLRGDDPELAHYGGVGQ